MAVAILLLCIFFPPRFVLEPLRTVLATVAWPLQVVLAPLAFEVKDTLYFLGSIGELKNENERLMRENIRLQAENVKWQSVASENDALRTEIGLLPKEKYELEATEVIGRDAAGLGNWLTVDRGSFQGVERGMPVIVSGGVLVGRVAEVFPHSARVMLLSHPDSLVSGVTTEGNAQGIAKGEYGLGILFDMVLQDSTLHASDRVLTSGLGGDFPKNLLIGTLQEPKPSTDHLYQRASIVSPVNFQSLQYVFIIKHVFSS